MSEDQRISTFAKGPSDHTGHDDQASRLRAMMERGASERADHASRIEVHEPSAQALAHEASTARPRIVTIASGKGGVGKTSLSVGIAATMARDGGRIALLDADLGLANADVLCGINASVHLGHALDHGRTLADIAVRAPGGFALIPGGSGVARLSQMDDAQRERVILGINDLAPTTDLTVVDCGAGVGQGVLAFTNAADLALVVTTPEPTSIADAYALLKLLVTRPRDGAGGAVRFALVVNNAKDEREALGVHERIDTVTRRFLDARVPLAGWVPTDRAVPQAVRERSPFVLTHPRCPASRGVGRLVGYIGRRLDVESREPRRERRGLARALRAVRGRADA